MYSFLKIRGNHRKKIPTVVLHRWKSKSGVVTDFLEKIVCAKSDFWILTDLKSEGDTSPPAAPIIPLIPTVLAIFDFSNSEVVFGKIPM